jgi:hypothetical protein
MIEAKRRNRKAKERKTVKRKNPVAKCIVPY